MAVLIRRLEEPDQVELFDCGDEPLNNYLRRHAWANQQKSSIGVTYVAIEEGAPRTVLGYFTLATASVPRDAFPKKYVRGLPPYDLPLILLARLAVDRRFSGKGLGTCSHFRSLQNRTARRGRCGVPRHHRGRVSRPDRLVRALRFRGAGGWRPEWSTANVSRYTNCPHGAEASVAQTADLAVCGSSLASHYQVQDSPKEEPRTPGAGVRATHSDYGKELSVDSLRVFHWTGAFGVAAVILWLGQFRSTWWGFRPPSTTTRLSASICSASRTSHLESTFLPGSMTDDSSFGIWAELCQPVLSFLISSVKAGTISKRSPTMP